MARRQRTNNLRTAGYRAARYTARGASKATSGLFRWAATDHTGMGKALEHMPKMGFVDTLKYILMQFLFAVAASILGGIMVFVLIVYGIPLIFEFLFY